MISFREIVLHIIGWESESARRAVEHYRELADRHLNNSNFYQGLLFHAWKCNRQQTKGLQRQARKIKRLQKLLAELMVTVVKS